LLGMRRLSSRLEGHPSPVLPWVDVATGSLGFGLPVGVGIALAAKTIDPRPYRVWVLAGDSEMAEGSVWEAFEHADHWGLDNLTVVVDVNRLGQSGETMHGWDLMSYAERARSLGWQALSIDGHDLDAIEDQPGWHGKVLPDPEAAIAELGGKRRLRIRVAAPPDEPQPRHYRFEKASLPAYELGTMKATRRAYGEALAALGSARPD